MEIALIIVAVLALAALVLTTRKRGAERQRVALADAKADARRWVERLGGQVLNLEGTDEASKQALADAAERYTAAGGALEQAGTPAQCRLVTQTAQEGLYYVRAARTAMGLDPGPDVPALQGQREAGAVSEDREVDVEGRTVAASPNPSGRTSHYYPGGRVAGRPVPAGWYSEPWWRPALTAGAWGVGSFLLMDALFSGMHGVPDSGAAQDAYQDGFADGQATDVGGDTGDNGDPGDGGGFDGGGFDGGGFDGGGFDGGGF